MFFFPIKQLLQGPISHLKTRLGFLVKPNGYLVQTGDEKSALAVDKYLIMSQRYRYSYHFCNGELHSLSLRKTPKINHHIMRAKSAQFYLTKINIQMSLLEFAIRCIINRKKTFLAGKNQRSGDRPTQKTSLKGERTPGHGYDFIMIGFVSI